MNSYNTNTIPVMLQDQHIQLSTRSEIQKWCELLECDEKYLRYAVLSIGNKASKVNDFLILNRLKNEIV
jgi:Protein of unknown function (DUF3606)